jgi:hypothetical protein
MRTEEIELAAAKNRPLPPYTMPYETCLYLSLRAIYNGYRKHEITKEQAQAEKKKTVSLCLLFEKTLLSYRDAAGEIQGNIRKAGTLLSEIEKSDNVYEIAPLACRCIGLMTEDSGFEKRATERITKNEIKSTNL